MRVISCFMIILYHGYCLMLDVAAVNYQQVFDNFVDKFYFVTQYIVLANDSFFFLSGLLFANSFFNAVREKGFYDVPRQCIHRYLRLAPSLAVLILIQATIYRHFGDGPLWKEEAKLLQDDCHQHWWAWLTFTTNYLTPRATCMEHCWWLSPEMQLYWISPIILIPILYQPALAPYLLTIAPFIFSFSSFGISYANEIRPAFGDLVPSKWTKEYVTTHTRGAPYMVGIALGYIIYYIKSKNVIVKLRTFWVITGWLASALVAAASFFGVALFLDGNGSALEAAIFEGFHRMGWALSLAWIVFACEFGYGGPVNTFLSWKAFQPLAKISYGIYIIHVMIQRYKIMSARVPFYIGDAEYMDFFISVSVISIGLSIMQLLFVEMPFLNLDKYFFRNVKIFPLPRPTRVISA